MPLISESAIRTRSQWIDEIKGFSNNFAEDYSLIETKLTSELALWWTESLLNHIRLCGNIPESYGHDTTEEKLYSKYTDALLSFAYKAIGLQSLVIAERADVADVEAFAEWYSFVADAKAFRLSRTAKNQKDFKVSAMDRWKHWKPYAMVVCPIYQLPRSSSQIYHQAITRDVCVFTYSHLALLIRYADIAWPDRAIALLKKIFETISTLNPSKSAIDYWSIINRLILSDHPTIAAIWHDEKIASAESIEIAKQEGLTFLAKERAKIVWLSHTDAIKELLRINKIDSKIKVISSIGDNWLFNLL